MAKLKLTGKELRNIGYPEGPVISIAMNVMEKSFKHLSKEDALEILSSVLQSPNQYAHDGVLGKIAEALIPKPKVGGDELPLAEKGIDFSVFGAEGIEQGALHQMHTAAKLPVAVAGALMPDAHHGYGLPIGGVLATENAVIPYGVGVDIGCFTGETKVKLADGRSLSFLELIEEDKAGKENFTFSLDKNRNVVISKIQAPRQTRIVDKLIEITLGNGEKYFCTPDHVHYLRNGKETEAKNLKPGDSLMPCYIDLGKNVAIEKKSYRDKRFKLEDYFVVYNPATCLYDYVHFQADEYNLRHHVYTKEKGNIRHHKDFNKHNNNPTNIQRVKYKEHFAIHSGHAKYLSAKGITGFKKAREKHPEFFAKMGSENMTRNHQNPAFAERRDKRAAEVFKKYNQTEAFYNMTRKAGERGREYLIVKNKSEEGRKKSKEVSQKKYQCPVCKEIVIGGFGIYNHTKKNPSCNVSDGNYKSFTEVKNHRVVTIKHIDCPPTPVYCLTINEHENFALDAGVFVHNCRMCLSIFDIHPRELTDREHYFTRELNEATLFGSGAMFQKPADHEVMERKEFDELGLLKGLQDRAWKQLGSSGSGNHFVEWGIVEIKEKDPVLGIDAGSYVGLLSHSGSRALGANVANHYTKVAKEKRRLPGDAVNLAWLSLEEQEGAEYWMAMNLAGDYASACHHVIHDKIAKQLGRNPLKMVENHHNFAWKEKWEGRDVIVHRKGATPAGKDVLGIIPGSMAAPGFIVKGKGEEASVNSASHGAGRRMSRTAALKTITHKTLNELLQKQGVKLLGGGLDEAPLAYKD
ncbi:MAG: RtcB family protein, partial [Flavisolibacter sp.]|nr:RtcB family protein [Flavisolibacter sp.]